MYLYLTNQQNATNLAKTSTDCTSMYVVYKKRSTVLRHMTTPASYPQEMYSPTQGLCNVPVELCGKGVRRNHRGIACDGCDKWHHAKCIDMTTAEYIQLSNSTDYWHCRQCVLPQFTDSFFDSSSSSSSPGSQQYEHSYDLFQQLDSVRMSCPKNIMISHLNINSVRYKFHELSDLFNRSLVDILFIE